MVAGLLVGFADFLRPRDQQTHIGRFFDELVNGAPGDSFLTIRRKLDANLASFGGTKLLWVMPVVALLAWYLWRLHGGRIRPLFRSVPVIRQTVLALAVVAVLGYALNDSGVAIPAVMALVFECALVFVALTPNSESVSKWRDYSPSATPERSVGGREPTRERDPGAVEQLSETGVRFLVAHRELLDGLRPGSAPRRGVR